ncbi:hypothetical protein Tco_0145092 [Tanacetum coccineum]
MVIKDACATAQNTGIVPHPTAGNSNNLRVLLKKIIGRKTNPELSSLEIKKLYNKKGMKALTDIEEVPFDVSDIRKKPNDSLDGVNLTRPVPKKGVKFEANDSLDGLNLPRPVPKKGVKFEANDALNGHTLTLPAPKKGVQLERSGDNRSFQNAQLFMSRNTSVGSMLSPRKNSLKKVIVRCGCQTLKKDWPCHQVQAAYHNSGRDLKDLTKNQFGLGLLECNSDCKSKIKKKELDVENSVRKCNRRKDKVEEDDQRSSFQVQRTKDVCDALLEGNPGITVSADRAHDG